MNELKLITPHGNFFLNYQSTDLLVRDVLKSNGIPFNSVSAYKVDCMGNVQVIPFLSKTVAELKDDLGDSSLVLRADRNIDYAAVINKDIEIYKDPDSEPTAEYTFDNHDGGNKKHILFSQKECDEFVKIEVEKFKDQFVPTYSDEKIVVGISGGGDSNTLLTSLIHSGVKKKNIIPVMMMGIADWDKGLNRAHQVCQDVGLNLFVVETKEVNKIIRGAEGGHWAEDFEKFYPESDLEVIGTLGIRLVLSHVARQNDTNIIVTGLNLEDILAEAVYSMIKGENFSSFPVRQIDDIQIWYPLYRCPKRILDGCHPSLSLENYMDRYPSNLYWRALSYCLAQSISTISSGAEFMLIDGLQKISYRNPLELKYYNELGFSALPNITEDLLMEWSKYINAGKNN
ncbi:tRNA lysidine(34) synthetase [Xenorhabdus doucetiae]|uniref:hypothetical protein n=1 Tax=Xenorhabdus doucetiae TaxID=351671 RepID=UPI002B401A67|nr:MULTISPECIES: hypothetical protein [unclassified Xenorhabdus]